MHVDLTKPDEPEEPAAATVPLPGPAAAVDKEPVRLTAREERTLHVKAFAYAVAAGSPVLGGMILSALWRGVQTASRTQSTAAPAPAPKKTAKAAKPVKFTKDDEPADDSGEATDEDEKPEKATPAEKAGDLGDTVERLAMGALVIGVACVMATGVFAFVWSFLAPYAGWIVSGLIIGWCLAAVHVAPELCDDEDQEDEHTPVNDHENAAGEQPQEVAPAREWARQRSAIRHYVEGAVAAGAAGYREEKGRGASVDSMLAEMQAKQPLPGWDRKRMIEFLELADIPVRDQVSFYVIEEVNGREKKVKKNLPAVHVDDLAEELGKTPSLPPQFVPDITPGQPPHLAAVPPLAEGPAGPPAEAPTEAPTEGPGEGHTGVA